MSSYLYSSKNFPGYVIMWHTLCSIEFTEKYALGIVYGAFQSMEEQWQLKGLEVKIHSTHNKFQVTIKMIMKIAENKIGHRLKIHPIFSVFWTK